MNAKQIDPKYHVEIQPAVERFTHSDGTSLYFTGLAVGIVNAKGEPVPDDEPMFLIRGRDHLAIDALKRYRELAEADDCTEFHLRGIAERIAAFEKFAVDHPERMKQPGCTRGL